MQATTGWQAASLAGEGLWETKIQQAIADKSRSKGIAKVGDAEWQQAALSKGAARIGPGIMAAVDKQAAHFAPFKTALEGVNLAAKTADPIANVTNRVVPIVQALVAAKKAQRG